MRAEFVSDERLRLILELLTYENYLVCCVALQSGLRINDCLALEPMQLDKKTFTITEQKTGKKRRVRLSPQLRKELREVAGEYYVFPHRTDPCRHRTRQAVYCDIRRACKALRIKEHISPHSLRKHYAVELLQNGATLDEVKRSLNHESEFVTLLYALSDRIELQALIKNRAKKG